MAQGKKVTRRCDRCSQPMPRFGGRYCKRCTGKVTGAAVQIKRERARQEQDSGVELFRALYGGQ